MRADTFAGQVIAVLSRRASAVELDSTEPQTFPGRLRALLSRRRRTDTASRTPTGAGQVTVVEESRTEAPETAEPPVEEHAASPGQQAAETKEGFDLGTIRILAHELGLHGPHVRLRVRAHPAFGELERSLERGRHDLIRVRDLARDLDRILARDVDRVRALARVLALARVRDRVLARLLVLNLDHVRVRDLDGVLADLDGALHDFTTADLRDVDLTRVQLEGLRWSSATQWPAGWVARIDLDSVRVAPDVFEVRRGSAYAPTPV